MIKKIIKNKVLIVVILCISFFVTGVKAANVYYAHEVYYNPTDSSWNVVNVNEALNSLYPIKNDLDNLKSAGTAGASNILSGYSAAVKGNIIEGTMNDFSVETKVATIIAENGDNAIISIPSNGFYDDTSKISVPIETIKNNVATLNSNLVYENQTTSTSQGSTTHRFTISKDYKSIIVSLGSHRTQEVPLAPSLSSTSGTVTLLASPTTRSGTSEASATGRTTVWKVDNVPSGTVITIVSGYCNTKEIVVIGLE